MCMHVYTFLCDHLGSNAKNTSCYFCNALCTGATVLILINVDILIDILIYNILFIVPITRDKCQYLISRLQIKLLTVCALSVAMLCLPPVLCVSIFALASSWSCSLPSCLLRTIHRLLLSLSLLYSHCCSASPQCAGIWTSCAFSSKCPLLDYRGGGHSHPPHSLGGKKVRVLSECFPFLLIWPFSHGSAQCPCSPCISLLSISWSTRVEEKYSLFLAISPPWSKESQHAHQTKFTPMLRVFKVGWYFPGCWLFSHRT